MCLGCSTQMVLHQNKQSHITSCQIKGKSRLVAATISTTQHACACPKIMSSLTVIRQQIHSNQIFHRQITIHLSIQRSKGTNLMLNYQDYPCIYIQHTHTYTVCSFNHYIKSNQLNGIHKFCMYSTTKNASVQLFKTIKNFIA